MDDNFGHKPEPERIELSSLTPDQWIEIKSIAVKLFKQGKYSQDQMKVSIYAFLLWLDMQGAILELGDNEFFESTMHWNS